MANPTVSHPHDVDQVLKLVEDHIPPAVLERIRPVLIDRDRAVEDGVNQGLRKTVSAAAFGNGGTITSVSPAWSIWRNDVVVTTEKANASSRFEVDATICGQVGLLDSIVLVGARWALADGTGPTTDSFLGQFPAGAGDFYTYSVHQHIAQGAPAGLYTVTVLCCVAVLGQSFKEDAAGVSSLRVTESVH